MSKTAKPLIIIGVITLLRPAMLSDCLRSLKSLKKSMEFESKVVVVDNDERQSAKDIVKDFKNVVYLCEPKRGYVHPRNRVLEYALKVNANYIAFIDDDEFAHPMWLRNLYKGLLIWKADAAHGPVVLVNNFDDIKPSFKKEVSANSNKTGTLLNKKVSTNNVLISESIFRQREIRFDDRFNVTGGEDNNFFYQSHLKGGKHIWVDNAVTYEINHSNRQQFLNSFRRHKRVGESQAMMYIVNNKAYIVALLKIFPKIIEKLTVGILMSIVGVVIYPISGKKLKSGAYKIAWSIGAIKVLFRKFISTI